MAPVFRMSVILPKLAEGFPPLKDPKLLPGFLYSGMRIEAERFNEDCSRLAEQAFDRRTHAPDKTAP